MSHIITKPFSLLTTSTQTIVVYTNILFNIKKIYDQFPFFKIDDIPLTKKRSHIDKKKISAPVGSIVSLQHEGKVKGLDMRRSRPRCTSSKINHFLNQVMLEIIIQNGDDKNRSNLLNVMIFKDNFKISGCKSDKDAKLIIRIIWEIYLAKFPETWSYKPGFSDEVHFLTDVVMHNIGFNLGFLINRESLNTIMNSQKYKDRVYMSQYETTGQTNVNIKMYSLPEDDKVKYKVFKYSTHINQPTIEILDVNTYRSTTKKRKQKYITLIVFSSSEIILSGSGTFSMESVYNFFVDLSKKNYDIIKEKEIIN